MKFAEAEQDVRIFEGDLPYLEDMLRSVRRSVERLREMFARDMDAKADPVATFVNQGKVSCDEIAVALEQAKTYGAMLRGFQPTIEGELPTEAKPSWERFLRAHSFARQELLRIEAMF